MQKTIWISLLDLGQQASTATFFQRQRFHCDFKPSILFELYFTVKLLTFILFWLV